jgi:hypothetical protein
MEENFKPARRVYLWGLKPRVIKRKTPDSSLT